MLFGHLADANGVDRWLDGERSADIAHAASPRYDEDRTVGWVGDDPVRYPVATDPDRRNCPGSVDDVDEELIDEPVRGRDDRERAAPFGTERLTRPDRERARIWNVQ